jgi:hypothetical protein
MTTHTGIQLRISVPAGPILDADSDRLHWIAKLGGTGAPVGCTPACLPGCQEHGWYEIIPGCEMPFIGAGVVRVEMRPVDLPDYVPED